MPRGSFPSDVTVTYSQQYRRCGKSGCHTCSRNQPGHGPYWYAFWRERGRLRSRYVGKHLPPDHRVVASPTRGRAHLTAENPLALRVRTLGTFEVWRGSQAIAPQRWRRRKAAQLFKLLLGAPGHRVPREQAIDLLWPDADVAAGATSLRGAIHWLRQALAAEEEARGAKEAATASAGPHVRLAGDLLALVPGGDRDPAPDWLDATAFERAAVAAMRSDDLAAGQAALAHYRGDYLPDEPYESWVVDRRERLRGVHLELLTHLARLAWTSGQLAEAERLLHEAVASEPAHEMAAQALMALLGSVGRRDEALRVYRKLETALREDLDVAPSADTRALVRRLRASGDSTALDLAWRRGVRTDGQPTNLQPLQNGFVGRRAEQSALAELLAPQLSGSRLVTLTGPGGVGKTRLAIEVGNATLAHHADGVWLVEIATLPASRAAGLEALARLVLRALSTGEAAQRDPLAAVLDTLAPRQLLLVLDNCEQVVASVAELATALLGACPDLRILATSREPLRVGGEVVWRVQPLGLPSPAEQATIGELERSEAIQLFVQRARLSRPEFALTPANLALVADICRRLDGLPLAIELATARLGAVSLDELHARLADRFRVLVGGHRTAPARQQTLGAALDWGYALLTEPERGLLRLLAVFSGGWTAEAVESVCTGDAAPWAPTSRSVFDLLTDLVDKSLVQVVQTVSPTRYALLESIREYAREKAAESGEAGAAADRHYLWCLDLAERAATSRAAPDHAAWLARLEVEHDNLHAALEWCRSRPERAERGLRLAIALRWLWEVRGYLSEGRRWLDAFLRQPGEVAPAVRAAALNAAGGLAYRQSDYGSATVYLEDSRARYQDLGNERGVASACNNLGLVAEARADYQRARACHQESMELKQRRGDRLGVAISLTNLGRIAEQEGDLARAAELHQQSLAIMRELGDRPVIARALNNLALVRRRQNDLAAATPLLAESLTLKRDLGDKVGMALTLACMADIAHHLGDLARAHRHYVESLALRHVFGDKLGIAESLEGLACVNRSRGKPKRATRLLSAARALREAITAPLPPTDRDAQDQVLAELREQLGEATFVRIWSWARLTTVDELVASLLEPPEQLGLRSGFRGGSFGER